jgi:hypothetical protein
MRLPNEPKGWRKLQRMAQRENDPQKLASIIDRMNRLLDSHEKMDANRNVVESATWNKDSDGPPQLRVQTWQHEA